MEIPPTPPKPNINDWGTKIDIEILLLETIQCMGI